MGAHQAYVPLDECVNYYLDQSEQSNHKYVKAWNLAFRAMDMLGLDVFYQQKCVKLLVNANYTVTLPNDFQKLSKVGVFNDSGNIIPLTPQNTLATAYDGLPTRLSQTQDPTIQGILTQNQLVWGYNYWNGYNLGTLYGLPSGAPFVGSYTLDVPNGLIVLDENFYFDYVVLNYVASPLPGGEYYVPVQFREAIIAFISWKDIESMPKYSLGEKEARKSNYYNERRLAIARFDPVNLNDAYAWDLVNQRLTVKA